VWKDERERATKHPLLLLLLSVALRDTKNKTHKSSVFTHTYIMIIIYEHVNWTRFFFVE